MTISSFFPQHLAVRSQAGAVRRSRGGLAVVLAARLLGLALVLVVPAPAFAHGFSAGSVRIDHPYAVPSESADDGRAYFRELHNRGRQPDRLLGATTSRAQRVDLVNAQGDVVQALELPPGERLRLTHRQAAHLRLVGLSEPLRDGDRFLMTLRFEHGGEREVRVDVQQPRLE